MSEEQAAGAAAAGAERRPFYDVLEKHNLAPLWESLHDLVTTAPVTAAVPFKWDYDVVRPHLLEAGRLITARQAERRVLILENPGLRGQARATNSLYAGIQLVLPGEIAPPHRHTQSALRFVLEGRDGYTVVEGERTPMQPGDLVTTPSWTWHEHGNETDGPMIWIDILDVPLVALLGSGFMESSELERHPVARPAGDSSARYAQNMLPVDWRPASRASPIFNYPYSRSREALATLARNGAPDPCQGYKLRYVNPATGGSPIPTIGTYLQLLPAGLRTAPCRSTDGTLYVVVEGEGESRVGDVGFRWKPRDIFAVPSWTWHVHEASGTAVLFSASDRPVQEALCLWREERAPAGRAA